MFIPKSKKYAKACAALGISAIMLFSKPSPASAAKLLKVGSSGSEVREVQSRLKELGYFKYPNITGYYGTITRDAVKAFQASKGLAQDGIVGSKTWSALKSGSDSSRGSSTSGNALNTLLKKGSRGSAVTQLQQLLKDKGYLTGSVDGIFGNQTYSAVRAFQKDAGLAVDGIVGSKTWTALQSGNTSSRGSSSSRDIISTGTLKMGSRGTAVSNLQQRLKDLGYSIGKVDGIFGSQTQKAVKAFQKDNGLVADGIAGPKTIAKLNNPAKKSGSTSDTEKKESESTKVEMLHWSEVDKIWPRGTYATIIDYDTGKSFRAMRSGGYNHADVETATAEDTAILKSLYGGTFLGIDGL